MSNVIIKAEFFFLEEAAISLGRREDLIKRAVEWCDTKDHPGVQGEANRLIAWLINNSRFVLNGLVQAPKLYTHFLGISRLPCQLSSMARCSI